MELHRLSFSDLKIGGGVKSKRESNQRGLKIREGVELESVKLERVRLER